jgi:hypothetical protein
MTKTVAPNAAGRLKEHHSLTLRLWGSLRGIARWPLISNNGGCWLRKVERRRTARWKTQSDSSRS